MSYHQNSVEQIRSQLLAIAKEYMYAIESRGDLDYHGNDGDDFVEVSVGSIEAALQAAYELGRDSRERTPVPRTPTAEPAKPNKRKRYQHER